MCTDDNRMRIISMGFSYEGFRSLGHYGEVNKKQEIGH